jgi:hypothetical protein
MYTKVCSLCQVEKSIDDFEKRNEKPTYRCKECLSQYHKDYYSKNRDKLKNKALQFRDSNPDYMKNWRKNNTKKVIEQKINWYNKNRNKINANERKRRTFDIQYKIKKNLRRRVNQVITIGCKHKNTIELLGCSLSQFLTYIENKFKHGMNWSNYGKNGWHIDHIIPCSSFDLTDNEQQKKCFHYTNLQPLWEKENLSKGNKIL